MRRILYLGTDPENFLQKTKDVQLTHYPIISIAPRPMSHPDVQRAYAQLHRYTHILFTSKNAVRIFFNYLPTFAKPVWIAIGRATAASLASHLGKDPDYIASQETQEGIAHLLEQIPLADDAYFLLPRSSLSRSLLTKYLDKRKVAYFVCDLYDTHVQRKGPLPHLRDFDEIVFTSPSTVRAFIKIFGALPTDKILTPIGPITMHCLQIQRTSLR
ncbi:MAG TPA: uroporphyrinogen-III synthase [Rhabdochlamydiaceae bacterium]|jgi:uroporphyrinogen-III synthase